MKLIELITDVAWDEIAPVLVAIDKEDGNLDGYKKVYEELKTLMPKDSEYIIKIQHNSWEDEEWGDEQWEEVYGTSKKDNMDYGLDFTPWEEVLGMEVDEAAVGKYSRPGAVAHCIREITFYGFDQESIRRKGDGLAKIDKEEYIPIEDLDRFLDKACKCPVCGEDLQGGEEQIDKGLSIWVDRCPKCTEEWIDEEGYNELRERLGKDAKRILREEEGKKTMESDKASEETREEILLKVVKKWRDIIPHLLD